MREEVSQFRNDETPALARSRSKFLNQPPLAPVEVPDFEVAPELGLKRMGMRVLDQSICHVGSLPAGAMEMGDCESILAESRLGRESANAQERASPEGSE